MDKFEKEILIQRTLWYISGTNDPRALHKDDTLYKGKLVDEKTADRVMDFMTKYKHKLKDEFLPSLNRKIEGIKHQVGVSTGNIWRAYPSHKVNSLFDELVKKSIGPDLEDRMRALFRIEKVRIDDFREKYEEACEKLIKEGRELIMPDPETHRYIDTFPDNADEYVKDRSKYIYDQFYNGLLLLKNGKDCFMTGYLPEFAKEEVLSPDLNIFFNRKAIEEDFINLSFSVREKLNVLNVHSVCNLNNPRHKEFVYMLELLTSIIMWGLNINSGIIDCNKVVYWKDYIKTDLEQSINNIFKLQMKDFING